MELSDARQHTFTTLDDNKDIPFGIEMPTGRETVVVTRTRAVMKSIQNTLDRLFRTRNTAIWAKKELLNLSEMAADLGMGYFADECKKITMKIKI